MWARSYCNRCGKRCLAVRLTAVMVARQTHDSPAEYEGWCPHCAPDDERDAEYERAAARYDGEGPDWR